MNRKYFKHDIDNVIMSCQKILPIKSRVHFTNRLKNSVSKAVPKVFGHPYINIALPSIYWNKHVNDIDEFYLVETVTDIYHEFYHVYQYQGLTSEDDIRSYVVRRYNNDMYVDCYDVFSHEISAELFGIRSCMDWFIDRYPNFNIDSAMLDYINARASGPKNTYSIHSQYQTLEDAFVAFEHAQAKSLQNKKDFSKYPDCYITQVLQKDEELNKLFNMTATGAEQITFAASILLDKYPNLCKELPILDKSEYDLENIKQKYRNIALRELPFNDFSDGLERSDSYDASKK